MCVSNQVETAKCKRCNEVKSVDLFSKSFYKLADGTKRRAYYECKVCFNFLKWEKEKIRRQDPERRKHKNAITKKYFESEKGMEYRKIANAKKTLEYCHKIQKLYSEVIHVTCCLCGNKQIKRSKPTMNGGYTKRCSDCYMPGTKGYKFPDLKTKEVKCFKCGNLTTGIKANKTCDDCRRKKKNEKKKRYGIKYGHGNYQHRARRYGVAYERVVKSEVLKRDEYKCYICGINVVVCQKYQKNQATLDHVIPMSKGGGHTYDNVKTCCNWCNAKKHDAVYGSEGMAIRL